MFRKREVERAMRAGIRAIIDVRVIQTSPGNWDHDAYMHGMANGLIQAESFFKSCAYPEFLDAPDVWGEDRKADAALSICSEGE